MYKTIKVRDFRIMSKFRNIRQTYGGYSYQSKLEAKTAQELDFRMKATDDGKIESWERQVNIPLEAHGEFICNYRIDFIATRPDGVKEYIECKGLATADWKIKWALFQAQYKKQIDKGEIEIYLVKA
jgi:hypothetical protein